MQPTSIPSSLAVRRRWTASWLSVLLAGCGSEAAKAVAELDAVAAEHIVARGRCAACHPAPGDVGERLRPLPAPSLAKLVPTRAAPFLSQFLAQHHAGSKDAAADLAAFLVGSFGSATLQPAAVDDAMLRQGEKLVAELACMACHSERDSTYPQNSLDGARLAAATDRAHLTAFLQKPDATRPDLRAHDFALSSAEAAAIASWLLRAQMTDAAAAPWTEGLRCECFELQVRDARPPALAGLQPTKVATVSVLDVAPRTREDNFALRFSGELQVPKDGDYTFTVGADDCGWLSIDGAEIVANAAIAPFRRKSGNAHLTAGWHTLELVFAEAGGGQELEVRWRGPGFEDTALAPSALRNRSAALVPPAAGTPPDAASVARGKALYVERRCGLCHSEPIADVAAATPGKPLTQLARDACTVHDEPSVTATLDRALDAARTSRTPRAELAFALLRDGCTNCHRRDDRGGVNANVRAGLVGSEDLGEDGRVPPDLTRVGHHLREKWLHTVLTGDKRARTYLHVRMPRLDAATADAYTKLFAAVDAANEDDREPEFSAAAATEGARLAGTSNFGCITCHSLAGHRALGAQGMDLAIQFERVRPQWFREWLLLPVKYRPGTRMPTFWPQPDSTTPQQIDALRTWLSLGKGAPLPSGLSSVGLVLEPEDKPRLHGAFLRGLSARCIAVGSPLRAHYAYDLAHLRLAWLWRGGFVDADGTWNGRAGQLLEPLGDDRVTLPEGCPFTPADGASTEPHLLGWRVEADGYPTFRLQIGTAVVEDRMRPALRAGGADMVRSVRAIGAGVRMTLPQKDSLVQALVGGAASTAIEIRAGETVEVVYRW